MQIFENPIVKKIFLFLRILIPILLLSILIYNVDFDNFISHLRTYPLINLFGATALIIIANLIFAIRWKYILSSVGIKVSNYQIIRLVFFSLFLSNFLPTSIGGDLVKLVGIVNATDNERKDLKVTSVLVDRIFSMLSKVMLVPLAANYLRSITQAAVPQVSMGLLSLSFLPEGIRKKVFSYINAIKPWYSLKKIAVILIISWASLAFTAAGYWVAAQPFGVPVTYFQILYFSVLTYFTIILPISINGIGVQEGSYIYLFTLISFTYDQAWTIALIYRLITILISIIGGIWMLIDGRELFNIIRKKGAVQEELPA
jgi:hypothetical protein